MPDETSTEADATAQRRQQWIDALLEERRGYETAGRADRVADVDEALRVAGHKAPAHRHAPEQTTARRSRKPKE